MKNSDKPAYPLHPETRGVNIGLTKREYFAAMVRFPYEIIAPMLPKCGQVDDYETDDLRKILMEVAELVANYKKLEADALLKALEE